MAFFGADIDQLKLLSRSLAAGATQLSSKARELDSLITQSEQWLGQDAKRFAVEWQSRLRPMFEKASQGMAEASKRALINAEEQNSASTDGSGATTATASAKAGIPVPANGEQGQPPSDRPTPEEILQKYQVSDAETTEWPSDWNPLRFVVDQREVTEKEAEMLNGLGTLELNDFKDIHDDAFNAADERFPARIKTMTRTTHSGTPTGTR